MRYFSKHCIFLYLTQRKFISLYFKKIKNATKTFISDVYFFIHTISQIQRKQNFVE